MSGSNKKLDEKNIKIDSKDEVKSEAPYESYAEKDLSLVERKVDKRATYSFYNPTSHASQSQGSVVDIDSIYTPYGDRKRSDKEIEDKVELTDAASVSLETKNKKDRKEENVPTFTKDDLKDSLPIQSKEELKISAITSESLSPSQPKLKDYSQIITLPSFSLYLNQKLPDNPNEYKNSYLFINNKAPEFPEVYYVQENGKYVKIRLNREEQKLLSEKLKDHKEDQTLPYAEFKNYLQVLQKWINSNIHPHVSKYLEPRAFYLGRPTIFYEKSLKKGLTTMDLTYNIYMKRSIFDDYLAYENQMQDEKRENILPFEQWLDHLMKEKNPPLRGCFIEFISEKDLDNHKITPFEHLFVKTASGDWRIFYTGENEIRRESKDPGLIPGLEQALKDLPSGDPKILSESSKSNVKKIIKTFNDTLPSAQISQQVWKNITALYEKMDLTILDEKQRLDYATKIENGLLYVKSTHPHEMFNPSAAPDPEGWVLADSNFGKRTSRRSALIYVLVEDPVTHKPFFYIARDAPGKFHHSSFIDKNVLSAGTLTVMNGKITMISNESGHYKPNENEFHKVLKYLDENAATDSISDLKIFKKTIDTPDLKEQTTPIDLNALKVKSASLTINNAKEIQAYIELSKKNQAEQQMSLEERVRARITDPSGPLMLRKNRAQEKVQSHRLVKEDASHSDSSELKAKSHSPSVGSSRSSFFGLKEMNNELLRLKRVKSEIDKENQDVKFSEITDNAALTLQSVFLNTVIKDYKSHKGEKPIAICLKEAIDDSKQQMIGLNENAFDIISKNEVLIKIIKEIDSLQNVPHKP